MADDDIELPQLYLITPAEVDLMTYPDILASCLDATEVSCVRLALGTKEEDRIARTADALREVTHARDVALVIDSHIQLVERLGLDGIHLTDGARSVKKVKKELGEDAIVGSFCGNSKHDGMTAGESPRFHRTPTFSALAKKSGAKMTRFRHSLICALQSPPDQIHHSQRLASLWRSLCDLQSLLLAPLDA